MSNPFRRVATKMATIILLFSQLSVPAQTTAARGSNADDKPFALREADPATSNRVSESYGKLPLSFEINRGQAGGDVRFLSRGDATPPPTPAASQIAADSARSN